MIEMKKLRVTILLLFALALGMGKSSKMLSHHNLYMNNQEVNYQKATLGAGCFWCVEAVFQQLKGVISVESGYAGGHVKNPAYKEVCSGLTGHAEVVQISFDPQIISYSELLEVFFATHDPTTLNQQGADKGTQYRSVIFYHDDQQKRIAELALQAANESGDWSRPVVTEITAYSNFFEAEEDHQNYYFENSQQPYCRAVIQPKLDKFKKQFRDKLVQ